MSDEEPKKIPQTRIIGTALVIAMVATFLAVAMTPDDTIYKEMTCDQMLDFSGSDEHEEFSIDEHMEFHNFYYDNCFGDLP
jgi:hypothetical protein